MNVIRYVALLGMVVSISGCCREIRQLDVVVFDDAKYLIENQDVKILDESDWCSYDIRLKVVNPAATTVESFRKALNDLACRRGVDANDFSLLLDDGSEIRFWPIGIYASLNDAVGGVQIFLYGQNAMRQIQGVDVRVPQSEVMRLIPENVNSRGDLIWVCQWDVTIEEIVRVSSIARQRGCEHFKIALAFGCHE